jgi:predicted acyltransferase
MAATVSAPSPAPVAPPTPAPLAAPIKRVPSIDAFRGLVMFLMLAEVMRLWTLHDAFPSSWFWSIVAFNTQHVDWQGCSLHDLIQPAFSFLAGASLPFSIASRMGKGESVGKMLRHAIRRSLILILLGIFLRSMSHPQTYWTFEDTLTQIGLGYTLLFLLAFASRRVQLAVFAAILVLFWAAFVVYPAPPPNFDYAAVGVPADFPYMYTGPFLAHFNKNANLSWAFDTWFLNLFPRESPFLYNEGGWSTLSFIPTLATMMMGMWTGAWLKSPRPTGEKLKGLVVSGVACTLAGLVFQWLHVCPIVKRVWTSSYTLYSGGLVLLILAGFYAAIDFRGWRRWSFPLMVIGANSIAIYVMAWTMEHFVQQSLQTHLGAAPFLVFGAPFEPVLRGIAVLVVFWSILYWMYRKAIFIKI